MAIRLEELFYTLDMKTRGFVRGVQTAQTKGEGFTKFMRVAVPAAAAAAGAALVLLGGKAAQMAADFEQGIAEVGTLVDTNVVNMAELRTGILDIFENVPVENVSDLTRGLYQMISAGIPAERAISDLAIAANAAVGGVTSVETAVDGLTTVLNAFAKESLTTAEAADSFFTAVRLGKTTFDQISNGIGRVAGLAASLGVTLDDLLGNMVALTKGGLGTRQAFTGLQQIMVNIAKPTSQLKKDFPELAENFNLARLKADGLSKFMVALAGELQGNDAAAVAFFGSVEALNAAFSLASDGGEQINEIMEEFANKLGSADLAALKMKLTTQATFQQLKNKFAVVMIDLGTKILPLVNAELGGMIGLLEILTGKVAEVNLQQARRRLENVTEALEALSEEAVAERLGKLTTRLAELQTEASRGEEVAEQITAVQEAIDRLGDSAERRRETFQQLASDIRTILSGKEFIRPGALIEQTVAFQAAIDKLTDDQIQALRRAFQAIRRTGEEVSSQLGTRFRQLNVEAMERGLGGITEGLQDAPEVIEGLDEAAAAAAAALSAAQVEALNDLRERAQELVDAASTDFVAKARAALEMFRADVTATGGDLEGEFADAVNAMEDAIASAELAEALDPQFQAIADGLRDATTMPEIGELARILHEEIIPALEQEVELAGENTLRRQQANDKLRDAQRLQESLFRKVDQLLDARNRKEDEASARRLAGERKIAEEQRRQNQDMLNLVGTIDAAVGGVIRLGEAFGVLSDSTAQALEDVLAIGTGIGRIAAGDIVGGGLAIAGGVGGLLGGLFGGSAEAKRIQQDNTRAIQQLSRDFRKASQFLGATAGGDISRFQEVASQLDRINDIVAREGLIAGFNELLAVLMETGVRTEELVEAGKLLGITFQNEAVPTFQELLAVLEQLQQIDFERFVETFSGSLALLNQEFELFDINDPIEKIRKILDLFLEFTDLDDQFPGADAFLRGLDLTKPADRQQLEETLQELFRQFRDATLDIGVLGGLTREEFLEQLLALERLLDAATEAAITTTQAEGEATTQFGISRAITEVTGSRIASLLATGVFFEERSAIANERMVELLENARRFDPIVPPGDIIPPIGPGGGRPGEETIAITVNVNGGPNVASEVEEAALAGIDRGLGERERRRLLQTGNVVVN